MPVGRRRDGGGRRVAGGGVVGVLPVNGGAVRGTHDRGDDAAPPRHQGYLLEQSCSSCNTCCCVFVGFVVF